MKLHFHRPQSKCLFHKPLPLLHIWKNDRDWSITHALSETFENSFKNFDIFETYKSFLVPLTVVFSADPTSDDSAEEVGILSALIISDRGIAYMLQLKVKTIATMMAQHNFDTMFAFLFSYFPNTKHGFF